MPLFWGKKDKRKSSTDSGEIFKFTIKGTKFKIRPTIFKANWGKPPIVSTRPHTSTESSLNRELEILEFIMAKRALHEMQEETANARFWGAIMTAIVIVLLHIWPDCEETRINGNFRSGEYKIKPPGTDPILATCDMMTEGGGWTIIQARRTGLIRFNKLFREFEMGFGRASTDLWLGNRYISALTYGRKQELRLEARIDGRDVWAEWKQFSVGPSRTKFILSIADYEKASTIEDGFTETSFKFNIDQMEFTAKDKDNDNFLMGNCADIHGTGFWWNNCGNSNVNGRTGMELFSNKSIHWVNVNYTISGVKMMVRESRTF